MILLAYASAEAYVARYAEPDKAGPGPLGAGRGWTAPGPALGLDAAEWPVPYWMGDAAFGVMTVLLCAVDAGLGACVLGNFRGEEALAQALGVPRGWRLFCAVPWATPTATTTVPRRWTARALPGERIHRGRGEAGPVRPVRFIGAIGVFYTLAGVPGADR